MMISARGLPANRESELREALELIRAGYQAIALRDGVTLHELRAAQRARDDLSAAAHERYRARP